MYKDNMYECGLPKFIKELVTETLNEIMDDYECTVTVIQEEDCWPKVHTTISIPTGTVCDKLPDYPSIEISMTEYFEPMFDTMAGEDVLLFSDATDEPEKETSKYLKRAFEAVDAFSKNPPCWWNFEIDPENKPCADCTIFDRDNETCQKELWEHGKHLHDPRHPQFTLDAPF